MDYVALIAWALPEATPLKLLAAVFLLVCMQTLRSVNSSVKDMGKSIDGLNTNVALLLSYDERNKGDIEEIKRRLERLEDSK